QHPPVLPLPRRTERCPKRNPPGESPLNPGGFAIPGETRMPTRAAKLCSRCLNAYVGRRCPTCLDRRLQVLTLRDTTPRNNPYLTPQWAEFSRTFRRLHPTCECPRCLRLPIATRPRSQIV